MKRVVWFETDLGFEATRQQLLKQRDIIIGDMETYKGILTFYVKDLKDYTVQITTKGKLGISYPESANYQTVLEKLKPLLVKADGSPIRKLEQIKHFEASKSEEKQVETVKKTKQLSEDELRINFAKAFVDSLPEGKLKTYLQNTLIHDLETLYPKLSLEQILDSWELEQEALSKKDNFAGAFIRNFKERVRKG
jgi:hypothetical protein